jgi:hypothetical protein
MSGLNLFTVLYSVFIIVPVTVFYIKNERYTGLYSLLLAIGLGLIAYRFIPPYTYDLYRHHLYVIDIQNTSIDEMSNLFFKSVEPLSVLISYLVSLTKNVNLLQLSIVTAGYWMLFSMLKDYAKIRSIDNTSFMITLIFTLASFTYINFISGLWNYFAMIIFALAFYLESKRQHSTVLSIGMYLITPLIHSSMFLPLALILIFKICGEKLNKRLIIAVFLMILSLPLMPLLISRLDGIYIFSQLESMYQAYFIKGTDFSNLYGGNILLMELLKLSICALLILSINKKSTYILKRSGSFSVLLIATILVYLPVSIATSRFILLLQFICFPMLMEYISSIKFPSRTFSVATLILLITLFLTYQYLTLRKLNFGYSLAIAIPRELDVIKLMTGSII